MADFSLPVLTSAYADFLAQMKSRDEDIIKMLDGTTSSNLPVGAKRWNATGNKYEKFDGSVWSDLTTLYEIKVRNSDQLNGQDANYYAVASHTHSGYASSTHTHTEYAASSHNHDTAYLGKTATASDSAKLNGYASSANATGNTIALRDASGDFFARMFRSTYAEQISAPATSADICFRNDAATDNYMRFMSSDAFKLWLTSIGVAITDTDTIRQVTDSVTTTSSVIAASATAVKTVYDLATTPPDARAVGSYATLFTKGTLKPTIGNVYAGSNFYYSHITGSSAVASSETPTGTWRCMSAPAYSTSTGSTTGLFLRVS